LSIRGDLVLDASTIVAYALGEEGSGEIGQVMMACIERGSRLIVPDLVYNEVANALLKARLRGLIPEGIIVSTLNTICKLPLESVRQNRELLLRASAISQESRLAIYDTVYIACAEREKAILLTCDKKQYEMATKYCSATIV